jgi:hypothetical protein
VTIATSPVGRVTPDWRDGRGLDRTKHLVLGVSRQTFTFSSFPVSAS